ncbi:MAG: glycogen/starch synthase [Lewinellaceae bacterium]|nr:glycogen/starch synthase [Lewinellaceae bacterium]
MSKKRILFVTQEMKPYTTLSEISEIVRRLPTYMHEQGMEIRILMPRFGTINERRHRLHEVVRLSGMNIIVDDDDYPLIIKVASLPGARLQVYFLDNDEFFRRKNLFNDGSGKPFEDNLDRMVFFSKGVLETIKKFGWPPDIIHCHGWMTSLVPLYLKTAYKNEPLFAHTKVIYSVYNPSLIPNNLEENFRDKAAINNLESSLLDAYTPNNELHLDQGAVTYADAVIQGSETIDKSVTNQLAGSEKPVIQHSGDDTYLSEYLKFYQSLLSS